MRTFYDIAKNTLASGEYKKAAQQFESIRDYLDSAALAQECYEKGDLARKDAVMADGKKAMAGGDYEKAAQIFETVSGYLNASELVQECHEKMEAVQKDAILKEAKESMAADNVLAYRSAITLLASIPGWKDADRQHALCKKQIAEIETKEEAARQEAKRQAERELKEAKLNLVIGIIVLAAIGLAVAVVLMLNASNTKRKFNKAMELLGSEDYGAAYALSEEISDTGSISSSQYERAM